MRHHQLSRDERINNQRNIKLLYFIICGQNLFNEINTWVDLFIWCPGLFSNYTRDELIQIAQRTKRLMTTHKALHPIDYIDRLVMWRKHGGRWFTIIKDCVDAPTQELDDYIIKSIERLLTAAYKSIATQGTTEI